MTASVVKFGRTSDFRQQLLSRVDAYFASTGLKARAPARMYVKSVVVLTWVVASYALLYFGATTWWQAVLCAISLSFAVAALSFNVPHDGSHGSYSRWPILNRATAFSFDLCGASSYVWHWKHNVMHHTFTNIAGSDADIELGALGRLSTAQPLRALHRFQHLYLWVLYGLIMFKWQVYDDFHDLIRARIGDHPIPRPRGTELVLFVAGKLAFLAVWFGIPLLHHSFGVVLAIYAFTMFALGLEISIVFQLAHTVEEAAFALPAGSGDRVANEWAVHQVETTVDYAHSNRALSWFVGGLNFQIEHHLFPKISHVHYSALAPIVEQVCRENGVRYDMHPTFRAALAAHYRWLRKLGDARFVPAGPVSIRP